MDHTLGDILEEAMKSNDEKIKQQDLDKTTQSVMTTHVTMTNSGKRYKIDSIKALRAYTGIGLKEAKMCVENPLGFFIPTVIFNKMCNEMNSAGDYIFKEYVRRGFTEPCRILC